MRTPKKIQLVEEHECEVTSSGRSQNVNFGNYTSSGEIIDWYSYRFSERKKYFIQILLILMKKERQF